MASDAPHDAPHRPTRRDLLIGLAAAGLGGAAVLGMVHPAAALTPAQAQAQIAGVVRDLTGIVNSGKPVAGMIADFDGVLARHADIDVMARSALGAPARTASAADIAAFSNAFRGYLARKYGGLLFNDYNGGTVEVTGTRAVQSFFVVESRAALRRRASNRQEILRVDWHVSDRSGRSLFFNMVIEGVNLLTNERQEIGALLDQRRGDIARLARDLGAMG